MIKPCKVKVVLKVSLKTKPNPGVDKSTRNIREYAIPPNPYQKEVIK